MTDWILFITATMGWANGGISTQVINVSNRVECERIGKRIVNSINRHKQQAFASFVCTKRD